MNRTLTLLISVALIGCGRAKPTPPVVAPPTAAAEAAPPVNTPPPIQALPELTFAQEPAIRITSPTTTTRPEQFLYRDDFAFTREAELIRQNGRIQPNGTTTRKCFPFSGGIRGELVMTIREAASTAGWNEQPGVLAFEWTKMPESMDYSGFRYDGRGGSGGTINIPPILTAATVQDLRGIVIRLHVKGFNQKPDATTLVKTNFRMEPLEDNDSGNRLDFGTLEATKEWTQVSIDLGDGTNAEKFLASTARRGSGNVILVWGQLTGSAEYHDGDGFFIDELEIIDTRIPAAATSSPAE